jgi:hypothetical protein
MTKFRLLSAIIFLCPFVFLTSCKKDLNDASNCFKLKAVNLYQGSNSACSSSIWRVESSPDDDIPPGTYVQFTTNGGYDPTTLKLGDIVYLKLTIKVMKAPGIDPYCTYDWTYFLHGDLCQ